MKRNLVLFTIAFALSLVQGLNAQNLTTTDVPRILSYQGHITNADQSVTGRHPITIRLYSDPEGKHKLWEDTYTTDVKDGIFSVLLGSQTALPSTERLDKPIWLGVSISGTDEMRPLTQFTTAPYALNVPDKSITMGKLSDDLLSTLITSKGPQDKQVSPDWTNAGDPYGCSGEVLGTNTSGCDLVLVTYGSQVMRYKYNATSNNILGGYSGNTIGNGAGNIIAGGGESGQINAIAANASTDYGVISGGWGNDLDGGGSFIGGGEDNSVVGQHSVVAGGSNNAVGTTVNQASFSAILGGSTNTVTGDNASILGGNGLTLSGDDVTGFNGGSGVSFAGSNAMFLNDIDVHISNSSNSAKKLIFHEPTGAGAGEVTTFQAQAQAADINYILPSTIGALNDVLSLVGVAGSTGTLGWVNGGGAINWKLAGNAGLTAGVDNFLGTTSAIPIQIITNNTERARVLSTGEVGIGTSTPGTLVHALLTNSTTGGLDNLLTLAHNSSGTAATGFGTGVLFKLESSTTNDKDAAQVKVLWKDATNSQLEAAYELHLAGKWTEYTPGTLLRVWRAEHSGANPNIIGGEENNFATSGVGGATISGGGTTSSVNKVTDNFGTVGGGRGNVAGDNDATLNDAEHAVVAGGMLNTASGKRSVVSGGETNLASGERSVVAGGVQNTASGLQSFVGGGESNFATGENNATVGGKFLQSQSFSQTVIGVGNLKQGTSTSSTFRTSNADDRIFIIGNGTGLDNGEPNTQGSNAYEVSNRGHSIVYDNLGTDWNLVTPTTAAISTRPAIRGSRNIDNTPIAWGRFVNGALTESYGVHSSSTMRMAVGQYRIRLDYVDPYSTSQVILTKGSSVVATISGEEDDYHCSFINTSPVSLHAGSGRNQFWIRISKNIINAGVLDCIATDEDFSFVVYGRPN